MKKLAFLLTVFMAGVTGFSRDVVFQHAIPVGLDPNPVYYGKSVFLQTGDDGSILLGVVGRVTLSDGARRRESVRDPGEPQVYRTVLWFLDPSGRLLAQRMMPGYLFCDRLPCNGEIGAYVRLTQMVWIGGHDLASRTYFLFDHEGGLAGKWEHLGGRDVQEAFLGDGIALYQRDADWYGTEFELVPLSAILDSASGTKATKGDRPRSVTVRFKNRNPNAFLYLGGPDMDYVVAFGATVWRESAVTRQVRWKVDDIGAGIQRIRTADGITLDVDTEKPGLVVLDAETGAHVAALDASSPALRGHGVYFYTARYEKGRFIFTDYRRGRKQILDPDTGEIRTEPLPAMRSDDTGMSVRTADGRTLRLEVVDGMVRLLSVTGAY